MQQTEIFPYEQFTFRTEQSDVIGLFVIDNLFLVLLVSYSAFKDRYLKKLSLVQLA